MKKWIIGGIIFLVFLISWIIYPFRVRNKIKYSPNEYHQKLDILLTEMDQVETVDQCRRISKQILNLGAACSLSFDRQFCIEGYDWMSVCIGKVAAKQNKQNLCSNKIRNVEICIKKGFPYFFALPSCVNYIEEECFSEFILQSDENTNITFDCNLFDDRNDCYTSLAFAKLDSNICLNISDNSDDLSLGKCMNYFAFRENNESLCNYGEDWQIKQCKEALDILRKNDVSICEKISSFYGQAPGKTTCYLGFATFNRDLTICSKFKDNDYNYNLCKRYAR